MNPVKKLMSWWRGPNDPESVEAERLAEDRDTIRISQNTATTQYGTPTNLPPTPDLLDPGNQDDHR